MKRLARPAFVITIAMVGCSEQRGPMNPPDVEPSAQTPEELAARRKKFGVHPVDADGHNIYRKSGGTCYVQVDNPEPPPKDLMSGERWVIDKEVPCPIDFDEPEFAAIGDGMYWLQDEAGECSQARNFGNPPPPPTKVACPPSLKRPGTEEPPTP